MRLQMNKNELEMVARMVTKPGQYARRAINQSHFQVKSGQVRSPSVRLSCLSTSPCLALALCPFRLFPFFLDWSSFPFSRASRVLLAHVISGGAVLLRFYLFCLARLAVSMVRLVWALPRVGLAGS